MTQIDVGGGGAQRDRADQVAELAAILGKVRGKGPGAYILARGPSVMHLLDFGDAPAMLATLASLGSPDLGLVLAIIDQAHLDATKDRDHLAEGPYSAEVRAKATKIMRTLVELADAVRGLRGEP